MRLLAPLAVVAAVILAVTLAWRLLGSQGPPYPGYGSVLDYDPRREGGHLRPNVDTLLSGERFGRPVRFVTNSKGFRNDREFAYRAPAGTQRILFVGDSFVDGIRTDQERTIPRRVERALDTAASRRGERVEVLVAGSNNPANAWFHHQEHGFRYHPDLVILGVTLGNDITWHNYGAGLIPETAPDGSVRLRLESSERPDGRRDIWLLLPPDAYRAPSPLDAWVDFEMRVRGALARRLYVLAQQVPPISAPVAWVRRRAPAADFMLSLGLFHTPPMPELERMLRDFEQVLAGYRDLVERRHASFLVVLFPVRVQVSERDWKLLCRATGLDPARFDLEQPNRSILRFCADRGMDCLDLLPAFREAQRAGQGPLYRVLGDMHFNEQGQAVAAAAIARHSSAGPLRRGS